MFKNAYQSGFLSIFYALGSKPLQIWDQTGEEQRREEEEERGERGRGAALRCALLPCCRARCAASHWPPSNRPAPRPGHLLPINPPLAVKEGHVMRVADEDIQGAALELMADNIAGVCITCPADPTKSLGARRAPLTARPSVVFARRPFLNLAACATKNLRARPRTWTENNASHTYTTPPPHTHMKLTKRRQAAAPDARAEEPRALRLL